MAEMQFQRFSDRFFQASPLYTKAGWYIKLRDGAVEGPFPSKEAAQALLANLFGITPEMSENHIVSTQESGAATYSRDSRVSLR